MALSKFLGKYAVTHGLDPDNRKTLNPRVLAHRIYISLSLSLARTDILPYTTSIADFLGSFLLVVVASSLLS